MATKAKDINSEMREEDIDAGGESRVYELGFHLDPELPTEEVKKAYQAVRALVEGQGTIVAEGEPIKIPLAYTISRQETAGRRDFDSAFFSWVVYETSAVNHAEIITAVSADKKIVRFIDVLTTKEAARHAAEMYELSLKAPEQAEDPEEVAGAALDAALENVTV
jgi:ribosomal protein S6